MPALSPLGHAFSAIVIEVFRLNGLALAAGDRLAAPAGLSSARWQVLGVVDTAPATVAQVARTMGLTRQSVQQTADALAREGFVEFLVNPRHRRAKLIAITEAGEQALRLVEARHAVWANRLGRALQPRLRTIVADLRRVRQRLEKDAVRRTR